jgi:hypothetical protein
MAAVTASRTELVWAIPGYSHLHPEPTPPPPPPHRKRGRPPRPKAIVLGPKRRKGRPRKHVLAADEDSAIVKRPIGRPRKDEGGVVFQFGKFVSHTLYSYISYMTNKLNFVVL